ncbi:MAG: helix-turn-helix transcriptional regulator [Victivallales bacterium]|nr:helix-turn-helix transcriptional regulator [Victivallales bacterium]
MGDLIFNLREVPRLMDFPFKVAILGWTSCHRLSDPKVIMENYVCLSFNRKKYAPEIVDDYNSLSFLPIYTHVEGGHSLHDEVFFSYKANVKEELCRLFGTNERILLKGFAMNDEIQAILKEIRSKLDILATPGTADALDALAIRLVAAVLTSYRLKKDADSRLNMDIYELAAELKQGASLDGLIRKYGFSRRTFYNEWRKTFSVPPVQYKLRESLTQAADMLVQTDLPIKEICSACGFGDLIYFYQRFRKYYGISPAKYRESKQ